MVTGITLDSYKEQGCFEARGGDGGKDAGKSRSCSDAGKSRSCSDAGKSRNCSDAGSLETATMHGSLETAMRCETPRHSRDRDGGAFSRVTSQAASKLPCIKEASKLPCIRKFRDFPASLPSLQVQVQPVKPHCCSADHDDRAGVAADDGAGEECGAADDHEGARLVTVADGRGRVGRGGRRL